MLGHCLLATLKNATYLQSNKESFDLQTDWITLSKYPLPGQKFVSDGAKSINLTISINEHDNIYKALSTINDNIDKALSAINDNISKLGLIQNKNYHEFDI